LRDGFAVSSTDRSRVRRSSLLLAVLTLGCGRLDYDPVASRSIRDGGEPTDRADAGTPSADAETSDAETSDAGPLPDGAVDGGGEPGPLLEDDFERADATDMGPRWVESTVNGGDFRIVAGVLEALPDEGGRQQELWFRDSTGSIDHWICLEYVGAAHPRFALSLHFRGAPSGTYTGLSAHLEDDPTFGDIVRYELFIKNGVPPGVEGPDCGPVAGLVPGVWMCGATEGAGDSSRTRYWRFESDPGSDPASFGPPTCEWTGRPRSDDTEGTYVGLGVYPLIDGFGSSPIRIDNVRAGPLR
jgi:hypothetical protein